MYWLVFETKGKRYIWIQEAGNAPEARLKSSLAGHAAGFVEMHKLDDKTASKVPKSSIGKRLSNVEAMKLLAKMG